MDETQVKSPKHYTEGRKYEPKDVIRDWGLNFNLGSAVKYLSRAGRKDDVVQDLKKAQEFIQFEIDAIEAERAGNNPVGSIPHPNRGCSSCLEHKDCEDSYSPNAKHCNNYDGKAYRVNSRAGKAMDLYDAFMAMLTREAMEVEHIRKIKHLPEGTGVSAKFTQVIILKEGFDPVAVLDAMTDKLNKGE